MIFIENSLLEHSGVIVLVLAMINEEILACRFIESGMFLYVTFHFVYLLKNRYRMDFDDGTNTILSPKDMIIRSTLPRGQNLFALDQEGGCYCPGSITGIKR